MVLCPGQAGWAGIKKTSSHSLPTPVGIIQYIYLVFSIYYSP